MIHIVLNSEENDPFAIRTELKLNDRLHPEKVSWAKQITWSLWEGNSQGASSASVLDAASQRVMDWDRKGYVGGLLHVRAHKAVSVQKLTSRTL